MDSSIFDGVIEDLIALGIAIGLALAGLIWGVFYLVQHIHISWK
jgi:uncharacterized membrane protein YciS (DUF1049 family)